MVSVMLKFDEFTLNFISSVNSLVAEDSVEMTLIEFISVQV